MPTFLEIYEKHADQVYNLCLQYLQHPQEAEEATQDVFVKIHQKMATFQGESALGTWIYRICINHCLDRIKARKRAKRFPFLSSLFNRDQPTDIEIPDFKHPGVLLEDREALELLFQKMNDLPENQKTALILRYLEELPPTDIAEIMQVSVKAVESLLQRAKSNLEKKLNQPEGNP